MKQTLLGLLLISMGALHLVALRKEWSWFMNNYQVRGMIESSETFFRFYTKLVCWMCIIFGLLVMFGKIDLT